MHGNGTLTFADKRKFTGSFKDGKIDGDGVLIWPDGKKYTGQFSESLPDGPVHLLGQMEEFIPVNSIRG